MPKTADFCAKASLRRAQGAENSTFALSLPLVALPASSCSKWARVMAQTACTVGFSRRARWDVHAIRHTPIVRTFCRARRGARIFCLCAYTGGCPLQNNISSLCVFAKHKPELLRYTVSDYKNYATKECCYA